MATALSQYQQSWHVPQPGCRIALVGFGTVGRSVARLLQARHDEHSLRLTHVCNRHVARKKVNWVAPDVAWTDDMQEVVQSASRRRGRADGRPRTGAPTGAACATGG